MRTLKSRRAAVAFALAALLGLASNAQAVSWNRPVPSMLEKASAWFAGLWTGFSLPAEPAHPARQQKKGAGVDPDGGTDAATSGTQDNSDKGYGVDPDGVS